MHALLKQLCNTYVQMMVFQPALCVIFCFNLLPIQANKDACFAQAAVQHTAATYLQNRQLTYLAKEYGVQLMCEVRETPGLMPRLPVGCDSFIQAVSDGTQQCCSGAACIIGSRWNSKLPVQYYTVCTLAVRHNTV